MNSNTPSKEEKERAQHILRGLDTIAGRRLRYTRNRAKKASELDMILQNPGLNHEQKRKMQIQYFLDESHSLRTQRANKLKIKSSDFTIMQIIGKGAFGEVRIVREKNSGVVYAMKTMLKKMMVSKNQLGHFVAERDFMVDADNQWLVKLFFAFQDATYLYLVMEYCGGGDLMEVLIKEDILSEAHTRFYISELAAAINHVHEMGYVHRDLKPDNVLIANDGHLRLSDFGLAKSFQSFNDMQLDNWQQYVSTLKPEDIAAMKASAVDDDFKEIDLNVENNNSKIDLNVENNNSMKRKRERKNLYSTVGTPDYIAIEVLYQKGYDKKVDWWSMGVIMFECLVGYAPFHAKDPLGTCRKIVRYERYFKIPSHIKLSNSAIDLMKRLVCPARRRFGWNQIQAHPWFKKLNWKQLQNYEPPFVPKLLTDNVYAGCNSVKGDHSIGSNVEQCGYSSTAINANRVSGYTFNRADAQLFQNYQRQAKESQIRVEQAKFQQIASK